MRPKVSWFKRLLFSGGARIEIYELLALLLDNRVLLIDALREIRDVLNETPRDAGGRGISSDDVKIRNVRAEAVQSWIMHLKTGDKDGFPLSRAIAPWVPVEEAALIQAGEATGNLSRALKDAVEGILGKGAMMKAVLGGTLYPLGLLVGAYFVMKIFAERVVPRFAQQVDPELWEGPARFLYLEVQLFNHFAVPAAVTAAITLTAVVIMLPYYTGPGRVVLDRLLPPWSIYKVIQGATFLKNVAVQTRAGIKLFDSVSGMMDMSGPWMRERLQAALYGIEQGQNLGEALHHAEYEFPDKRSVQILRVLASRDGFDETLYSFAKRWEQQTVKQVEAAARLFLIVGIVTMGGVAASAFMGLQGLSAMVQDQADAVGNRGGG